MKDQCKKQIDELNNKIARFAKHYSYALEKEKEKKKDLELKAKSVDPRVRYQQDKEEIWAHPSVLKHDEECSKYLEKELGAYITEYYNEDPQAVAKYHKMKWECLRTHKNHCGSNAGNDYGCIPECPYYPDEGLETWDGRFTYPNTQEHEMILRKWDSEDEECGRHNVSNSYGFE